MLDPLREDEHLLLQDCSKDGNISEHNKSEANSETENSNEFLSEDSNPLQR